MKIKLLLALTVFLSLLFPLTIRADTKPELFGSQKNAAYPTCSGDGALLAVLDEESNGFQMWDTATRRSLWKSDDYLITFSGDDKAVMVAHSTEPLELNLTSLKGVDLKMLDARTGRVIRRMSPLPPDTQSEEEGIFLEGGFSLSGNDFILVTPTHLHIYNVRNGALRTSKKWSGVGVPLTCAALLHDKEQLVAYADGIVILDALKGTFVRRLPLPANSPRPGIGTVEIIPDSLMVSYDDYSLAENFDDDTPSRLYRLSDGKLLWSAADWPTFSADGKLAYVPSQTGLDVFEAHTGRKLKTLSGPKEYGFDVSPDARWLYEARDDRIYRWRAQ